MERTDITKRSEYDIRYFEETDLIFLKNLLLREEICQWFPLSSEEDVDLFLKNWINFARFKCALTALYEGHPIGFGSIFLLPYRKVAIHTLGYLLVDPRFQRMGVGTSLLRNMIHLSRNFKIIETIQIEMYEGCPIESLLRRLSFQEMFVQKGFIKIAEPQPHYKARIVFERSNQLEV
ncbi:MAG: GNAT family N-acetyltransferase [Chlamydiia bacterium]